MRSIVVAFATAVSVAIVIPALVAQQPAPAAQAPTGQAPAAGVAGQQGRRGFGRANTPTFPGPPAGMQKLATDLFNSKNFYKDKDLWSDKRYFRCNTPRQITDIWTSRRIGDNPPNTASWSDCDADYPRDKMVSHLPYKTAKAHYDALMAQAKARGGPTAYSRQNMPPDWDGWYAREQRRRELAVDVGARLTRRRRSSRCLRRSIRSAWCR